MGKSVVGVALVCAALFVSGCSGAGSPNVPAIEASCVPPQIFARISEESLVVSGEVFLDDCADVIENGTLKVTPEPFEGIVVTLTQGDVSAVLGTISATGDGSWALGIELATLFEANPKLTADSALVVAETPSGHEAQTNVTLELP